MRSTRRQAKGRKPHAPKTTENQPALALELFIKTNILAWRSEYERLTTPEASLEAFRIDFLRRLHAGDVPPGTAAIVELAENGHPAADAALRDFIEQAMDADRFQQLPVCVRNYARKVVRRPELPLRYPSTAPQIVNNYKRDLLITRLIDRICERWPEVPPLCPRNGRRAAAGMVGSCLGLSEIQVRRIYKARQAFDEAFVRFMNTYRLATK